MTVGGNYFLIGAYVMNMTDKLTIVKESGHGASHLCLFFCVYVRLYADVSTAFTFKLRNQDESQNNAKPVERFQKDHSKLCTS